MLENKEIIIRKIISCRRTSTDQFITYIRTALNSSSFTRFSFFFLLTPIKKRQLMMLLKNFNKVFCPEEFSVVGIIKEQLYFWYKALTLKIPFINAEMPFINVAPSFINIIFSFTISMIKCFLYVTTLKKCIYY